jgi:hypothetical protein
VFEKNNLIMKKIIYTFILMAGVLLSGCEENSNDGPDPGMIWDFANWDVCFLVKNAAGENLMDPEVVDNWLDRDIYVEYRDEIYPINAKEDAETRANKPIWRGLRTEQDYCDKEPIC